MQNLFIHNTHIVLKKRYSSLCLLTIVLLFAVSVCGYGQQLPSKLFDNQSDYSYMWWMNTVKLNNKIFAIKTNKYAFSFNYPTLSFDNFSINNGVGDENVVLRETNAESFPSANSLVLKFGIDNNGTTNWCSNTSNALADCQLIETGKYFQRRFINKLPDLTNCDKYNSGFEISSWSDRLNLIFRALPTVDLVNTGLVLSLKFPDKYGVLIQKGDMKAIKNPIDGSGFILLKSKNASTLTILGTTATVKLVPKSICDANFEMNTGLIIYPIASNIESKLNEIYEQENAPLTVIATQKAPTNVGLDVVYDKDMGWHKISLRNDGSSTVPSVRNNRIERVDFSIENTSAFDKTVRLNFSKERLNNGISVFSITGLSAVLRDSNGNPIGIPVQLSKNWHNSTNVDAATQPFRGTWYRGLCTLTIPANSTISLEYTSVNALWGGIPAASHAQLCLVGWGSNQQWDESAIGSWGESITYEPDLTQAGAPVLDFRPLMIKAIDDSQWGWTGNMGGADFFNYTKTNGIRSWHSRMRTQYKRYSPNLTEVTYAGTTDDDAIDFEYTTSVSRSQDMVRGIYHIKMNVLKNFTFNDFVFFQTAARTYHYTKSNSLAWGNETGLVKQWNATISNTANYMGLKEIATGNTPWFSFCNSFISSTDTDKFLPANRGFVIRSWKAKINGEENIPPYYAEYNAVDGHGEPSSIINITAPTGCTTFRAGDYLEADIELFQIPKVASDYYGPNQAFSNALASNANTWKMVYREAIGNNVEVNVISGNLLSNYPIKIQTVNDVSNFTLRGGKDYVPITITNVSTYNNPEMYQKVNGSWVRINQSVYGNDFWQTEYNSFTKKWEITYNINLDTTDDILQTAEFKFQLKPDSLSKSPRVLSNSNIHVFPNPLVQGDVNIQLTGLSQSANLQIKLFDMHSRLLFEKNSLNKSEMTIKTSLKSGAYLIVIKNVNESFEKKIIVCDKVSKNTNNTNC